MLSRPRLRRNEVGPCKYYRTAMTSSGNRVAVDNSGRLRPLLLRELAAEDLPRCRAWDFLDELDLAHALVVGDPLLHERDELVGGGLCVRSKLHEGLRDLAGLVVGLSDDSGVGDRGMLAEHRLDFGRSDAEPLVLDELLLAIDDEP